LSLYVVVLLICLLLFENENAVLGRFSLLILDGLIKYDSIYSTSYFPEFPLR